MSKELKSHLRAFGASGAPPGIKRLCFRALARIEGLDLAERQRDELREIIGADSHFEALEKLKGWRQEAKARKAAEEGPEFRKKWVERHCFEEVNEAFDKVHERALALEEQRDALWGALGAIAQDEALAKAKDLQHIEKQRHNWQKAAKAAEAEVEQIHDTLGADAQEEALTVIDRLKSIERAVTGWRGEDIPLPSPWNGKTWRWLAERCKEVEAGLAYVCRDIAAALEGEGEEPEEPACRDCGMREVCIKHTKEHDHES